MVDGRAGHRPHEAGGTELSLAGVRRVLPEATGWLLAARRRRLATMCATVLFSGSGGAVFLYTASRIAVDAGLLGWSPFGLPAAALPMLLCVAAFTAGLVLGLARLAFGGPSLLELAREADRRLELHERLSTAVEVAGTKGGACECPVERALILDAGRRVRPHAALPLAPWRLWAAARWGVGLIGAALLLHAGARALFTFPTPAPTESPPAAAAALVETGHEVRRVAALVAQRAEWQQDAYLRTVSNALSRLAAQMERGQIEAEAAVTELSRLLAHLNRALGPSAGQLERDGQMSSVLASRQPQALPVRPRDRSAGEQAAGAAPPAPADGSPAADPPGRGDPLQRSRAGLDALLVQLSAGEEEAAVPATPGAAPPDQQMLPARLEVFTDYGDAMDLGLLEREREANQRVRLARGDRDRTGSPGGGGQGDSSQAGKGAGDAPEAGRSDPARPAVDPQLVELPAGRGDGRHIRIEVPPEARYTRVGQTAAGAGAGWAAQAETPLLGESMSAADRPVIGRYFMALIEAAAERAQHSE